ncbi:uncharacterized protein LOC127004409 [Eriocheir sinensis]|uniref:uncharacterized protein LOC127004409 n=1 Tax=Eriocheir sinensis TaxID=95602 RepID=UPI0021C59724|nr:uncharacterized protein LOC127004409 [Eriocheir sinensis]
MFSNGFFAFHPSSHAWDEFPMLGRRPGDLVDRWMEILEPWSTGALVSDSDFLSRPCTRCCPHTCLRDRPQPAARQHLIVIPRLLSQPSRSDQQEEGAEQQGKKEEPQQKGDKQQQQPAAATDAAGEVSAGSGKAPGESPWQFSVDMSGCDEVRAMTDKGMLMVEGRGSSDTSQQMVRYITSLPRHVSQDSLSASLNNGRLTVTQKAGAQQLEGQARTLPIQTQTSPEQSEQDQSASSEAKKQEQPRESEEQQK